MTLSDLVSRLAGAAETGPPLAAVAACLRSLAAERDRVAAALSFLSGAEPAIGLHVYGTDLVSAPRRIWDPVSFEAFPHSEARYAELAARAAEMT